MYNYQSGIYQYWNDQKTFNYHEFFKNFHKLLGEKLALHGCLNLDDYIKCVSKYYDLDVIKQFVYESHHTEQKYNENDILKAIFEPRYKKFRDKYLTTEIYSKLNTLHKDLLFRNNSNFYSNVELMERCIHAEHNSGKIIGLDIADMRRKYERLLVDPAFGILTRAGLEEHLSGAYNILLIDINDMHTLNDMYGYDVVNQKIRGIFSTFKMPENSYIGRLYCGDEIIIANTDSLVGVGARLVKHALKDNIKLKYKLFKNKTISDLEKSIGKCWGK
jgi:GGDEF domain-containing protein